MTAHSSYKFLTLAGTLPFIACALLPVAGVSEVAFLGSLDAVAASYGLLIASFMAGTHWGQFLTTSAPTPLNLFLTSNALALFVWFAYLSGNTSVAVACQIIAFLALLTIDYRLQSAGLITQGYLRMRLIATLIVVAALLLVIAV